MHIKPLLVKQPSISRAFLGYAMSSYLGGRSEVRIRKVEVPVSLLDFTSMYPTIFLLENLQELLIAQTIAPEDATEELRALVNAVTLEDLFDPKLWPKLRGIALVALDDELVPLRCRFQGEPSNQIALAHVTSPTHAWYTVADLIAAKLLGGRAPRTISGLRFRPIGVQRELKSINFRGMVELDPRQQIFKTIVEQRQLAKRERTVDKEAARLYTALKILANSASYGVFAEINISDRPTGPLQIFGLSQFQSTGAQEERPGKFFDPFIATLVTGGARLMLAMLEASVASAGGVYAYCDTDSLAIVAGTNCPEAIPALSSAQVDVIARAFDRLNPYDPSIVPELLKKEYENVRCFTISAKRYVLYTRAGDEVTILRPSEHGLGALIDDSEAPDGKKLPQRIWEHILFHELGVGHDPHLSGYARRQIPIRKPHTLARFSSFNKGKPYRDQVKPWNFLQALTPTHQRRDRDDVLPIAPFERSMSKTQALEFIDWNTGRPVHIDWYGGGYRNHVEAETLQELADQHAQHPEAKGAGDDGNPSGPEFRGLLGRLHVTVVDVETVGKEIDRLDEDEGIDLGGEGPVVYADRGRAAADFKAAMALLRGRKGPWVAARIGLSPRQWRRIGNGHSRPSAATRGAIIKLARGIGFGTDGSGAPRQSESMKP